ncbi:MAG: M20/M25/M40 family metallo-hydrolase [Clostridia bacterium]|nr:M20/M25/M40 family metallo-hydrolase [Clostridia bacterium]
MFVFDVCEEGLGNSDGCRKIMETYSNIEELIAVDGKCDKIFDKAVASHKYSIEFITKGGHSFSAFGNDNAIHLMSSLIVDLYNMQIPQNGNSKTTLNVGNIVGGTTINSIAQKSKILFEYRSDDSDCLKKIQIQFNKIVSDYKTKGYNLEVVLLGERPCEKNVDANKFEHLLNRIENCVEEVTGTKPIRASYSMDCNISMSMGIPSSSIGVYWGKDTHTETEYLHKDSLKTGYKVLQKLILSYADRFK